MVFVTVCWHLIAWWRDKRFSGQISSEFLGPSLFSVYGMLHTSLAITVPVMAALCIKPQHRWWGGSWWELGGWWHQKTSNVWTLLGSRMRMDVLEDQRKSPTTWCDVVMPPWNPHWGSKVSPDRVTNQCNKDRVASSFFVFWISDISTGVCFALFALV